MHLFIALKAFFLVLFNGALAERVNEVLRRRHDLTRATADTAAPQRTADKAADHKREAMRRMAETTVDESRQAARKAGPQKSARSEAITLLATLQREGRFVDFLKEDLGGYADAQIGAVARDLHRDCAKVVERMFAVQPLLNTDEGAAVEVPAGFDAARYRLVGNVAGAAPFRGMLVHHGWQATRCDLAEWVGGEDSARVIAPVEVEVK
jgi:uncharacterized protein DUF2760